MLSVRSLAKIKKKEQHAAALAAAAPTASTPASEEPAVDSSSCCPSRAELGELWARRHALYQRVLESLVELRASLWEIRSLVVMALCLWLTGYFFAAMLSYLQAEYSVSLPSVPSLTESFFAFAAAYPLTFLILDFGGAFVIGVAFLYREMVAESLRELKVRVRRVLRRRLDTSRYVALEDEREGDGGATSRGAEADRSRVETLVEEGGVARCNAAPSTTFPSGAVAPYRGPETPDSIVDGHPGTSSLGDPGQPPPGSAEATSPLARRNELMRELRLVIDRSEEVDIRCRVLPKKSSNAAAAAARAELKDLHRRRDKLQDLLGDSDERSAAASRKPSSAQSHRGVAEQDGKASSASSAADPNALSVLLQSALVAMLARSANGFFSVGIYFADLISDVQVRALVRAARPSTHTPRAHAHALV